MRSSLRSCASRQQKRDCSDRKMEAKAAFTIQSSHSCFLLAFLLLISNMQTALGATTTKTSTNTYKTFLKTSCNSTTYPKDCYKALSPYYATIKTDSLKLCYTSLSVTLQTARNTSALVSSIAEQGGLSYTEKSVVKDCIEEVGDSMDELKQSLEEMSYLGGSNAQFHKANIQTWLSAAETDENTCTDDLDDNKVRKSVMKKIRKSILILVKQTSNSLALINSFQY